MDIWDQKYVLFTTFTKEGVRKSAPVWIARSGDLVGFTTGSGSWKLKRLANDPRCEIEPCDARGRVTGGAMLATGKARLASADEFDTIKSAIAAKYGIATKIIPALYKVAALFTKGDGKAADSAVVIEL